MVSIACMCFSLFCTIQGYPIIGILPLLFLTIRYGSLWHVYVQYIIAVSLFGADHAYWYLAAVTVVLYILLMLRKHLSISRG
jgi:hypothetical protein